MTLLSADIVTEDIGFSLFCLLMVSIDCAGSVKESSFFVLFHGQMTIMYLALSFHTLGEKSASFIAS